MKGTFIKHWGCNSVFGFNSSKGISKFTTHDISESNMRCDICISELWHGMSKHYAIEIIIFLCEGLKQT